MSTKAEVNQALMNEIAELSNNFSSTNQCQFSTTPSEVTDDCVEADGLLRSRGRSRNAYPTWNRPTYSFHEANVYHYKNDVRGYSAPAASPLGSATVRNDVKANNSLPFKNSSTINRYKIDRRVKVTQLTAPRSSQNQPVKNIPSPKKYEVLQKHFLKRRRSMELSPIKKILSSQKKQDQIFVSRPPLSAPKHQLANRALQRSLARLRAGKNPVCSFFKKFGRCLRQEHCPFLHIQHISQIGMRKAMKKLGQGVKPPCVFYLRGRCVTIDCPFPHITPEEERNAKEKQKLERQAKKKETKLRYYEQNLNISGDCIRMIVPRNNRPVITSSGPNTVSTSATGMAQLEKKIEKDFDFLRRERLMSKIAQLKTRYASGGGGGTGTGIHRPEVYAPEFLPFKKL